MTISVDRLGRKVALFMPAGVRQTLCGLYPTFSAKNMHLGVLMRCSKCGSDNREGAKFCNECGTPFGTKCAACGAHNQPDAKFCDDCGAALISGVPVKAAEVAPAIAPSSSGERRHLTVLFCDLVGSTEIAAQLDPEEWRALVARYHHTAAEAITRYGGHVAQYLGDGVMAYFGWPEAHENDAERAARAGLAILETVSQLNQKPTNPKISVRVGIDSGAVVVGASAGKDADVFGETPNIAARVQTAAAPDTVLITGATHRLLSGLFMVEECGAQALKGVAYPVELFRVLRPSGVRGRLAAARGLTPFVGREEELRCLLSRWERARDGEGHLVLVVGEAGIGKSRLVAEFHERIRDTPHMWIESAGEQFFQNSPFHAVSEMLSQWLKLQGGTTPNEGAERMERALASAGLKTENAGPLIADLLQLPVGERYPTATLTPEQRRRQLLAALAGWVLGAATVQPVVMVVEDLHWLDPSTLELVQLLGEQDVMVPLMLICTARPEFHPQWPMRSHHTQITLNRLNVPDVRAMIALVAARNALASDSVEAVIERTGGVPLFVEELTRAVVESGGVKLGARAIPETLHDSLMARLDRLGSAKSVLQLGSVIGGEFSYELLRAVHPGTESELESELRKLIDADLLYFRGIPPDATYRFKHTLIRDAAYEALLKSRRKELHELVARTIDEKFPDIKQARPEVLARHWTEAGKLEPAIAGWSRAGKSAEARYAFGEALDSYRKALQLLNMLRKSPDRDRQEAELSQSVVRMLWITRGYSAAETIEATRRATLLAEESNSLQQLLIAVHARGIITLLEGDVASTAILADQVLNLALREGGAASLEMANNLQMVTHFFRGDLAGAETYFAAGSHVSQLQAKGVPQEPVTAFGFGSFIAWMQGQSTIARERSIRMMAAASGQDPFTVAFSGIYAAQLQVLLREYERAEASAAAALEISDKHQLPYLAALSRCLLGHARAQLGRVIEGVKLIRQGITRLRETESRLCLGLFTAFLATAQETAGSTVDALESIEQALQANPEELVYRPEVLRIRGELRLQHGQMELAESDFLESNDMARSMGATAWGLRTSVSLARLLANQGRRDDARTMLANIYNWFTEGFDTADLKEAKALLEELST